MEKDLNKELENLHKNLLKHDSLCIPRLTNNVGNCLFESLDTILFVVVTPVLFVTG